MAKLNIGIIGCGRFASNALQYLLANPLYRVRAACDTINDAAEKIADRAGADYHTTDVDRLIDDKAIDAVFVMTRHDSHDSLTVKAANAKKHVFCEKPMALSIEGCKSIAKAVNDNGVIYCIGLNRRTAPMVVKARELLSMQKEKKIIYHRVQEPFPPDHWTHDHKIGGGRLVGEGCHSYDMLCELTGSPPVTIYAAGSTFLDPDIVKAYDSAAVTITFQDESVCVTIIASTGNEALPKEATEIYCGGKAIIINNFRSMECYGYEGRQRTEWIFDTVDKGFYIEYDLFAKSVLEGGPSPNGLTKAARASVISYKVKESIDTGKPIDICENEYTF